MTELGMIYRLLRAAFDGGVPEMEEGKCTSQQWWQLFCLLQRNHVAAVTAEAVTRLPKEARPPREVLVPWLAECEKVRKWSQYQREVEREIIRVMGRHGVDTLVLKGSHVATYYPQPLLREYGDLDLYFYHRHAQADRIASQELGARVRTDAHHHSKYDYRGVTVESHYDFVNRHTPWSNRRYEAMLKRLAPTATFEVLFLLRHMAGHFASSRITLRDLCDWYLTWRKKAGEIDLAEVERAVAQFQMRTFVTALGILVERHFGYRIPIVRYALEDVVVERVERDIVYGSAGSQEHPVENLGRLTWKWRRYRANQWKYKLVYPSISGLAILVSSLVSHTAKPQSILHKM